MRDDDFLLDDDESLDDYTVYNDDDDDDDDNEDDSSGEESDSDDDEEKEVNVDDFLGKMTENEIKMSNSYDYIKKSAQQKDDVMIDGLAFDTAIIDGARNILNAMPMNTSSGTVENHVKTLFQTSGHNRIPASVYSPDLPLRSNTVGEEFGGDEDGFNEQYTKDARDHIARFVKYLSTRDLSRDSITSRRRKLRELPALIIFLFNSGMYDLIINCPTMPPEYQEQINNAFKKINEQRRNIIEALAARYESKGRQELADSLRKTGADWFSREPHQLMSVKAYRHLNITSDDLIDYREFRPKYINASKSITQDIISDLILVILKPGKLNEKLKDRTRSDAIADVKELYRKWSKDNPSDSEFARKIIWKELNLNE